MAGFNAPDVDSLISEMKDGRGRRNRMAIIIPTKRKNKIMEHIDILDKQTCRDFDILAVYSKDLEFVDHPGILHIREKKDFGSAGAFYIGEKIALREGYSRIILADDDCFPDSDSLISTLESQEDGNCIVLPYRKDAAGGMKNSNDIPHHYGCFSSSLLIKSGLTFLPMYFGGEDLELLYRMKNAGAKVVQAESSVIHGGSAPTIAIRPDLMYYYRRGNLAALFISGDVPIAFRTTALNLVRGTCYTILGHWDLGKMIFKAVVDASRIDFSRNIEKMQPWDLEEAEPANAVEDDSDGSGALWIASSFLRMKGFGKEVYAPRFYEHVHLATIMLARRVYTKMGGKTVALTKKRGLVSIATGMVLLALAAPLVAAAAFFFGCIGLLLGRGKSKGYGIIE